MCLVINKKFHTKKNALSYGKDPLIAKQNMYVYKLLLLNPYSDTPRIYSPFKDERYWPGFKKEIRKFSFKFLEGDLEIHKGLHCFLNKQSIKELIKENRQLRKKLWDGTMPLIVKAKIIKGTPYFKNDNEIVSLALDIPRLQYTIERDFITITSDHKWEIAI